MKYIRTKDGIVETTNVDRFSLYFELSGEQSVSYSEIDKLLEKMITKQADTIEELCDEFRVRDNDNYSTYEIDITCRNLKELYEELQIQNQTLFGAIWIEWGLKYVAKMNEKGELELLWTKRNTKLVL
mgnify:CR=1 FL=1